MDSDYDAGHGLPTDFPSDPHFGGFYIIGGLSTLLLLALAVAVLLGFLAGLRDKRRANYEDWPRSLAGFIRYKSREVTRTRENSDFLAGGAGFAGGWFSKPDKHAEKREEAVRRNARDIDPVMAGQLPFFVDGLLGRTIALGETMNKQVKGLNDALDGFKEIKGAVPVTAAAMPGNGTVINIAVNQTGPNTTVGDPVQTLGGPYQGGPYSGTAIAGAGVGYQEGTPPVEIGKEANIWLTYTRFCEDWAQPDVMAAIVRSAQDQLYTRPPEPPKPQP